METLGAKIPVRREVERTELICSLGYLLNSEAK